MIKIKRLLKIGFPLCITIICVIIALHFGSIKFSVVNIIQVVVGSKDIAPTTRSILLNLRLPRIILAFLVGSSLSLSGCILQGILRNPLADPYIIGASSGASLGAALAIIFVSNIGLEISKVIGIGIMPIFAFLGAIITVYLVYQIAKVRGHVPIITMLLAGTAVSTVFSAAMSLLLYFSSDIIQPLIYWLMGSFNARGWSHVQITLPYAVICLYIVIRKAFILDAFAMGEERAQQLGVEVEKEKRILLIVSALLTGAAVAVSGVIGFVGLLIPHVTRLIYGPRHRQLAYRSWVWGGNFLVLADTLARTLISPTEIPVGIITSLCGGPFFIYLLRKEQGRYWQA